jgi:hypothetical protein
VLAITVRIALRVRRIFLRRRRASGKSASGSSGVKWLGASWVTVTAVLE